MRHKRLLNTFLGILTAAALAPVAVLADVSTLCKAATELRLSATWRDAGDVAGAQHCYRITVPSPGILALDVSAPGNSGVEPMLDVLGGAMRRQTLDEKPRSVLVEIRTPGTLVLAVSAEDPVHPLPPYKLRNAFVSFDGILRSKEVDEWDDDVVEAMACSQGEIDDHGDTPLCATPLALGEEAAGTLANAVRDDEDVFTFVLDAARRVEVSVEGDVRLSLEDERGQRLVIDGAPRFVRRLTPGRYFLRLDSESGDGGYVLGIR